MDRKLIALSLALGLASAAPAEAQNLGQILRPDGTTPTTRVGTRGANFLEFGVGARAHGLAGAVTGLSDGATSLFWNTAGSVGQDGIQAAFSYADLFDSGITHTYGAVVLPVGQGAVGASFIQFSSGAIPRTTEDWPDGGDPVAGNEFEWNATAFGLHYAHQITDRLSFGGAVKYAQEGLELGQATYVGLDLGTRFRTGIYGITLGAALNNVGSSGKFEGPAINRQLSNRESQNQFIVGHGLQIAFRTSAAQMPTIFRFGVQTDLIGSADAVIRPDPTHRLIVAADVADGVASDLQPALGVEYAWRDLLYVRGGKRWFNELERNPGFDEGLAGGFGLRIPALGRKLAFDYSYTGMGELRNVQVFSLEFGY